MHDARDAEDKRLLESGNHNQLLENYVYPVQERLYARLLDADAAAEVGQRVFLRLAEELARGKQYDVPFRVVVWNVVHWTVQGYEWGAKRDASLPDGWDPPAPGDELEHWQAEHDVGLLLADLPKGQREVAELVYREHLSLEQVAERLGIKRNAADQRLHNAHRKLAEKLGG